MVYVAGTAIVLMMMLTCVDVVLRYFRNPIPGIYELVRFFGVVAVAFAMAYTSVEKGHVAVSLIIRLLPDKIQGLVDCITSLLGLFLFSVISWQSVIYGNSLRVSGEVSLTLQMPFYPFIYGLGISSAVVCLVLIAEFLQNFKKALGK